MYRGFNYTKGSSFKQNWHLALFQSWYRKQGVSVGAEFLRNACYRKDSVSAVIVASMACIL